MNTKARHRRAFSYLSHDLIHSKIPILDNSLGSVFVILYQHYIRKGKPSYLFGGPSVCYGYGLGTFTEGWVGIFG